MRLTSHRVQRKWELESLRKCKNLIGFKNKILSALSKVDEILVNSQAQVQTGENSSTIPGCIWAKPGNLEDCFPKERRHKEGGVQKKMPHIPIPKPRKRLAQQFFVDKQARTQKNLTLIIKLITRVYMRNLKWMQSKSCGSNFEWAINSYANRKNVTIWF